MITCAKSFEKHLVRIVLSSLVAVLPSTAISAPNQRSVAEIAACLEDPATTRVCSSKELSNVVVQCDNGDQSSYFFKHDDLDDPQSPSAQFLETAYEGVFQCPGGEEILAVFIKSGSEKHPGRIDGAPGGLGRMWSVAQCPVECPETDSEEDEGDDGDDDPDVILN